ncbi:MAG: hypothetical protein AB8I08_14320 [Sandaracinaceae bacterium]
MNRVSKLVACAAWMMAYGCGASGGAVATGPTAPIAQTLAEASAETVSIAGLPAAPWSQTPLSSDAAPAPVLTAWAGASNRGECAPLAPAAFGAAEGAEARVSPDLVEGGWAVEFDRRGLPGMQSDGDTCANCGRGVFGIAGTRMTPGQLVSEDDDAELPTPTFADGSHLAIEPTAEGEAVSAATLTVQGQGCVYQVWSFLGETHVRELVDSLRLVDVAQPSVVASR